jgi:hypothetical protein
MSWRCSLTAKTRLQLFHHFGRIRAFVQTTLRVLINAVATRQIAQKLVVSLCSSESLGMETLHHCGDALHTVRTREFCDAFFWSLALSNLRSVVSGRDAAASWTLDYEVGSSLFEAINTTAALRDPCIRR